MAWFGDGLPSLSNLKGQLTNFTKEVLSEGIVEEIDERSKELKEANQKCVELQEILNSKDAEISLLRRQNCELQKAVVELNAKSKSPNDTKQDDEGDVFFWDPPSARNRSTKSQNHVRQLQEQLAQATVKIRDLEAELKHVQKVNGTTLKEEHSDGHQKAEFLRAKQDMVNRIIQMEEKSREAERNTKRMQSEESTLISDFRTVLSKLNSLEKLGMVQSALKALEIENRKWSEVNKQEKFDFDEKPTKRSNCKSAIPKPTFDDNLVNHERNDECVEVSSNKELELQSKIDELREENKRLFTSIEELDQQHEESIEKLLSLKEEIEKKHQCLQNAYEQLYVEYNQAQDKAARLEAKLTDAAARLQTETAAISVQTECPQPVGKYVQTNDSQVNEKIEEKIETRSIDELIEKVKDILKNTSVDVDANESIVEAVAKQYVDAKWKKEVLEKKVTELSRELKSAVETKENLQMECDVMQSHIDTLLLEIQDLKLNLPSIPEASEERVASLESETESLREELQRLQAENSVLRKENAILRGEECEARLGNQGYTGTANRGRKLTRLEDIPEDIEDIDGSTENLSRKLLATLDENNDLRRKIDFLENSQEETEEQLRTSLAKCKGLEENVEFMEELKLDLENERLKLQASATNAKQLENSLVVLRDAKEEIEKANEELCQRNEQLETEVSKWRENRSGTEDTERLKNLREQLERVEQEKNDLERDILNVRKDLIEALERIDAKESCIARLSQENESLLKEKASLMEQLTAIQDESDDKIDLVSTEKSLLEQEQTELKEKVASNEKELNEILERLRDTEDRYARLENEYLTVNEKAEKLQLEYENLENEKRKYEELLKDVELNGLNERLNAVQNDYTELSNEVKMLRERERELPKLRDNLIHVTDENTALKSQCEAARVNEKRLEHEVACLQAEKKELLSRLNEDVRANEKREILAVLEETTKENDALKKDNSKLIADVSNLSKQLQEAIDSNKESSHMAKETIESLSHLVREKDEEISDIKEQLDLAAGSSEISKHFATVQNERDELVKLVTVKHNESLRYHSEIQRLTHLLNEQATQIQSLLAKNETNVSELKEKNGQLLWAKNELLAVQQRLKNVEESSNRESCGIAEHAALATEIATMSQAREMLEDSLHQAQSRNQILENQLAESQNKEANAAKELERLRMHLVEMESSYTEEALLAEETRKELEAKLQQAEEKMKSSSTAYTSANIRANQQVETLHQQMALIIQQRDDIQNKLSAAEDKILSQTASLTNLQIVLEQFQRDKEKDIAAATERIQSKLKDSYRKQEELAIEITNQKEQLAEAKECLQAASRLSEQLDKKTERIEQLSEEVDRLTNLVNTADQRIEEAKRSGEGKVDKTLIKNLLLGYLSSSAADTSSVLRVFSTVLEFNEAEKEKAGLNNSVAQNGWFSRLSGGSTAPNKDQEASLSAAFIRFLENESKPKPQLPALPIQTSPLSRPGHSRQHSTSSTQSTLLLSNVNLPTFPDFIPARNTGSILKEVLKDS